MAAVAEQAAARSAAGTSARSAGLQFDSDALDLARSAGKQAWAAETLVKWANKAAHHPALSNARPYSVFRLTCAH